MSETKYLPYLDGWRGLAILCLLIGHFLPIPGINLGSLGVNLFFVLSGLLMTRILFLHRVALPSFYRRRISRIFPSVFVFLSFVIILHALTGRQISWFETITAATFVNNYLQPQGEWTMPFGHIWSLSVEEHSYILLSFIALLVNTGWVRAKVGVGLCTIALASVCCTYWMLYGPNASYIHSEVAAFGIFASGSLLLLLQPPKRTLIKLWAFPMLMGLGVAAHWWSVPSPAKIVIGCGAFALALNLLCRAPKPVHVLLQVGPLRMLGRWSFSIYLWQQLFYMLVHREGMHALVGLFASIIVGVLAFYLIENPSRLYLNRVWTGRTGIGPPHSSAPDDRSAPPDLIWTTEAARKAGTAAGSSSQWQRNCEADEYQPDVR
jgi:peptidoglycan/LPS O-acetylase OafA/YrhL